MTETKKVSIFDKLPGRDEVTFERKRGGAHQKRIDRINEKLPDGVECALIDRGPYEEQQIVSMEADGYRQVPMSEARAMGITDGLVSDKQILLAIRTDTKNRAQFESVSQAHSKVRDAAEFSTGDGAATKSTITDGEPITIGVIGGK